MKLTIKDCIEEIKVLRNKYDTHRDVEQEENDWYVDAFLQAEEKIRQRFGIKK